MECRRPNRGDSTGGFARLAAWLFPFFCIWLMTVETSGSGPSFSSNGILVPEKEGAVYRSEIVAVYVVKEGDRLTDLARRFYGDSEKTWLIEEANELVDMVTGQVLVIPLQLKNPGGLSDRGYQTVPILTYHHFRNKCSNTLCLPIDEFSTQMAFLKRAGYRTVTMRQVLSFINYNEPLPRKAVAITFDEGYRSVYDLAYPILKKHSFKATVFIYTSYIGTSPSALTWDQLREMSEAGFEVEAHTFSHADLTRKRKGESEPEYLKRIRQEMRAPRQLIYQQLGQEPIWLAYPYGRTSELVIAIAKEEGYRGGVTLTRGANPFFVDPFRVGRNQVTNPVKGSPFKDYLKTFNREALE
jgi:peptidoglycan/xylan/chitin deacetylase (PgdA/CDA1 family)